MKKILFNDKFGLTQAVLDGRKTMTRRVIPKNVFDYWYEYTNYIGREVPWSFLLRYARYKIGEIVAIAQNYESILCDLSISDIIRNEISDNHSGYKNKMFVKAELMPHQIKITNIRVERLQNISDDDCLREGVDKYKNGKYIIFMVSGIMQKRGIHKSFRTPREAFAALIDKVSGRGTWQSNPLVWVYEFELVD